MNKSNILHATAAVLCQAVIGMTSGDWITGAVGAVCFFVGREHSQAEYRWLLENYERRENLPDFQGFRDWPRDAWLDIIVPAIACATVFTFAI